MLHKRLASKSGMHSYSSLLIPGFLLLSEGGQAPCSPVPCPKSFVRSGAVTLQVRLPWLLGRFPSRPWNLKRLVFN
jgi:hypothetical protein